MPKNWTVIELLSEFEDYEDERELVILNSDDNSEHQFVIDDSEDVIKLVIE